MTNPYKKLNRLIDEQPKFKVGDEFKLSDKFFGHGPMVIEAVYSFDEFLELHGGELQMTQQDSPEPWIYDIIYSSSKRRNRVSEGMLQLMLKIGDISRE